MDNKIIDVNEDADILHRLGILDSKLECPNKKKDSTNINTTTTTKQTAMATSTTNASSALRAHNIDDDLEAGDGWSGLSLSETSSSSSSDEDNTLFDRQTHIPSTSTGTPNRKRLRKPRRGLIGNSKNNYRHYRHRGGDRHQEFTGTRISHWWKMFALLSAAAFLGFSMPLQQSLPSALLSGIEYTEQGTRLIQLFSVQALALLVGSIFAAFTMLRFNPFAILLLVMFFLVALCSRLLNFGAPPPLGAFGEYYWSGLLYAAAQAFVAGTIGRAILLLTPLWTGRYHRTLFVACALTAFAASASFTMLQQGQRRQQTSGQNLGGNYQIGGGGQKPEEHGVVFQRRQRQTAGNGTGMPTNGNLTAPVAAVPSYLQIDLDNNGQGGEGGGDLASSMYTLSGPIEAKTAGTQNKDDVNSKKSDNNVTKSKSSEAKSTTTTSAEKSQQQPQTSGQAAAVPVFKTKTEENAFRRKEVEMKRKKELEEAEREKEEAAAKLDKKQQQQTTKKTTTTSSSTTSTTSSSTSSTTTTTATTTAPLSVMTTEKREATTAFVAAVPVVAEQQQKQEQQQQQMATAEAWMGNRNRGGGVAVESKNESTKTPAGGTNTTTPTNVAGTNASPTTASPTRMPQNPLLLSGVQFTLLCLLLVPLVFGFCCCCVLDHPICSSQYKQLPKLLSPISAHAEPFSCQLLSFLLWAVHFSVPTMLELIAIVDQLQQQKPQQQTISETSSLLFSPMPLFWLISASGPLFLTFWPSIAFNTTFMHAIYFLLISACSIVHFILPLNNTSTFLQESGLAVMAFATELPILLYVWYCQHSKCAYRGSSARYMFALALAKFCTPLIYVWWQASDAKDALAVQAGQVARQMLPNLRTLYASPLTNPSMGFFVFGTLIIGYALFLLLLAKLRRVERHQRISQLSGALNGGKTATTTSSKKPSTTKRTAAKKRTKGQYSLLDNTSGKSTGGNNKQNGTIAGANAMPAFSLNALDTSEEDEEEFDEADVEMESIGGGGDELQMVTMKSNTGGANAGKNRRMKKTNQNVETEGSSVEDLV